MFCGWIERRSRRGGGSSIYYWVTECDVFRTVILERFMKLRLRVLLREERVEERRLNRPEGVSVLGVEASEDRVLACKFDGCEERVSAKSKQRAKTHLVEIYRRRWSIEMHEVAGRTVAGGCSQNRCPNPRRSGAFSVLQCF